MFRGWDGGETIQVTSSKQTTAFTNSNTHAPNNGPLLFIYHFLIVLRPKSLQELVPNQRKTRIIATDTGQREMYGSLVREFGVFEAESPTVYLAQGIQLHICK